MVSLSATIKLTIEVTLSFYARTPQRRRYIINRAILDAVNRAFKGRSVVRKN